MSETVLVTGITGFIAKRVAFDLLRRGNAVVGSLRDMSRADEVRSALRTNGTTDDALARLRFVTLDLTRDDGWGAAMTGIDAVMHTASPFPLAQPKDENALIRPAVEGTLRVLRAAQAAAVTRVILTSSMEAVMHGKTAGIITEADWSDLSAPTVSAYTKSKTLAERTAWDFVASHPEMRLTVINPGVVLGRPMDVETGSSISIIARFLRGRDPMVPDFSLPITDIADVSAAHVAALDRAASIGQRYVVADRFMKVPDLTRLLKTAYPAQRIATRVAPRPLVRLLSLFDPEIRMILPWLGWSPLLDSGKVRRDLGIGITPAAESILASAAFLSSVQQRAA